MQGDKYFLAHLKPARIENFLQRGDRLIGLAAVRAGVDQCFHERATLFHRHGPPHQRGPCSFAQSRDFEFPAGHILLGRPEGSTPGGSGLGGRAFLHEHRRHIHLQRLGQGNGRTEAAFGASRRQRRNEGDEQKDPGDQKRRPGRHEAGIEAPAKGRPAQRPKGDHLGNPNFGAAAKFYAVLKHGSEMRADTLQIQTGKSTHEPRHNSRVAC